MSLISANSSFRLTAQQLKLGIVAGGHKLVTPIDSGFSFGMWISKAPRQGGRMSNALYNEYGIAGAATAGIRLCPTIYNTIARTESAGIRVCPTICNATEYVGRATAGDERTFNLKTPKIIFGRQNKGIKHPQCGYSYIRGFVETPSLLYWSHLGPLVGANDLFQESVPLP